jgi:hypothetical protein
VVDFNAAMLGPYAAQDAVVVVEQVTEGITQLVQEPGGSLDVCEQQRESPLWQGRLLRHAKAHVLSVVTSSSGRQVP